MSHPQPPTLRLAMLNADTPVPTILPTYPTYGRLFHTLLSRAAKSNPRTSTLTIQSADFNLQTLALPPSPPPFDALIISGSASSAYDSSPWIAKLREYLKEVYEKYPHVKIFGSCFGHQIICASLLDLVVEPDPKGWEIGVQNVTLDPQFLSTFPLPPKPRKTAEKDGKEGLRLQFIHHDHVLVPSPPSPSSPTSPSTSLPPPWITIGHTPHCAVQGIYLPGRVFTLQGHFEFDRHVNGEVVKYFFGGKWDIEKVEEALREIDREDDAEVVAGMVLGFLLGTDGRCRGEGGLVTPPGEE